MINIDNFYEESFVMHMCTFSLQKYSRKQTYKNLVKNTHITLMQTHTHADTDIYTKSINKHTRMLTQKQKHAHKHTNKHKH